MEEENNRDISDQTDGSQSSDSQSDSNSPNELTPQVRELTPEEVSLLLLQ